MSVADQVHALRTSVGLWSGQHLVHVRLRGPDAFDALDRVSPRELFVRSGQLLHTLLLDDDAHPIADVYLGCDEDDMLVIAEGMAPADLVDLLRDHARGLEVDIEHQDASHAFLCLAGPYAWELLSELSSPDVIGLPYLGFFHEPRFTCFRAGKIGEYGYDLLVERARVDEVHAAIREIGLRFDLALVDQEAVDLCARENWFFNVRRDAGADLTPIELQLQWRVSYGRQFPGAAALADRRGHVDRRAVLLAAGAALTDGDQVRFDGAPVGTLTSAGPSPTRGDWLAVAVVDRALAHSGLPFTIASADGEVAARSISAPAVNNRSLYVDPQRHSYATRESDRFPALVPSR